MSPPTLFPSERTSPGEIERFLHKQGLTMLLGVDEAGRGALFGPVTAAAVVFGPQGLVPDGVRDSKELDQRQREELEQAIMGSAAAFGVGMASAEEIDSSDILRATFLAMRRAIEGCLLQLGASVQLVLVDGPLLIEGLALPQKPVVKGDQRSLHIAAASILAKVARDRLIVELAGHYPGYGLERNKGYGTAAHQEAIGRLGLSSLHRRSFCKGFLPAEG